VTRSSHDRQKGKSVSYELRTWDTPRNLRLDLDAIKAARHQVYGTTIAQSSRFTAEAAVILKKLKFVLPSRILQLEKPPPATSKTLLHASDALSGT
jgi:hypothetical protein